DPFKYLSLTVGLIFMGLGVLMLIQPHFTTSSDTLQRILGMLLVVYGSWRIYRIYNKTRRG
nr:hypothetical protein [Bacteroidota bacterium]